MALINNTRSRYDKAVQRAAEARNRAAALRAEAARLEEDSAEQILADESAAERIAVQAQAARLKANAFDKAASKAETEVTDARAALLEEDAQASEKEAARLHREAEKAGEKVDKLLQALQDADGSSWVSEDGGGAWERLHFQAVDAERRAVTSRYYAATGRVENTWLIMGQEGAQFRMPSATQYIVPAHGSGAIQSDGTIYVDKEHHLSPLVREMAGITVAEDVAA